MTQQDIVHLHCGHFTQTKGMCFFLWKSLCAIGATLMHQSMGNNICANLCF